VAAGAVFLTVLRTNDPFCLPQSSWVALLSIAHRYEFMNVRKRAIREIYDRKPSKYPNAQRANTDSDSDVASDPKSTPDYVMLISAAEKYDVPLRHVVPAFVAVVMREQPLADIEAALLSMDTVVRLARAREEFLRKILPNQGVLFSPANYEDDMARKIVSNIWQIAKTGDAVKKFF
jgi:hypothetical protein